MKKSLTKFIVSCTAVTAVAAAMAMTASAANVQVAADKMSITNANAVPAEAGKQATILVQKKTDSALTEGDIYYIDQAEASAANWGTIKFASALEDATYTLKMGGEGVATIVSEDFTVGGTTADVMVGDVNGDEKILTNDAVAIVDYVLEKTDLNDAQLKAADTNVDGKVLTNDAVNIVDYVLEKIDSLPVTK